MLEKVSQNIKGLSSIFATLIILAVVTTLFIPVFIWASGLTAQTKDSWQLSGVAATERIVIEEANLQVATQSATVYVRNIGESAVTINNVLISRSNAEMHVYQDPQISTVNPATGNPLTSIIKGNLLEIRIPNLPSSDGFTIVGNTTYTIQVYTTRGVGDTYQTIA